jgi:hypothetical protein
MPTNDSNKEELENHSVGCRMSKAPTDVITNAVRVFMFIHTHTHTHTNKKITTSNI